MSDDFDREAEREKLREQYERDQAKREASERMSELLLQGATMTNRHCPECHSPVFTYEGTAFCPTCEQEITEEGDLKGASGDGSAAAGGDATAGEDATAEATDAAGQPTANGDSASRDAGADGRTADTAPDATPTPDADTGTGADAAEEPTADASSDHDSQREETRPAPARDRRPARVDPPARRDEAGGERRREAGDLADAEAALVREITNLTRRAEETRDVGRKRDFFAAAREAAETLETVRRL